MGRGTLEIPVTGRAAGGPPGNTRGEALRPNTGMPNGVGERAGEAPPLHPKGLARPPVTPGRPGALGLGVTTDPRPPIAESIRP